MSRSYPKISKSLSFPNALVGNPDESMTGPPTKTFGGDNFRINSKENRRELMNLLVSLRGEALFSDDEAIS